MESVILMQKPAVRQSSSYSYKKGVKRVKKSKSFIPDLPVMRYKKQIQESLDNTHIILTAETGAGKSIGVPFLLKELGYKVLVLEPRVVSCTQLCKSMKSAGVDAGFKTGRGGSYNEKSDILYVTYGVGINMIPQLDESWIVIFDEIHEWTAEMDIAPSVHKISQSKAHVIIMSATIDLEAIRKKYPTAPQITIPGRTFDIEIIKRENESPTDSIIYCLEQGWNTLVFLPGQKEINDMINELKFSISLSQNLQSEAIEILPLIGSLNPQEMALPFTPVQLGKVRVVLSTNIGQTGLTLDYMDAVVNTGLDRQIQVQRGVQGLYSVASSKATNDQRKGRIGRTHRGYYIENFVHNEEVPPYDTPEVKRVFLSDLILRVASLGYNIKNLDMFHKPTDYLITQGIRELQMLKCLDEEENITGLGKQVSSLPIDPRAGVFFVKCSSLNMKGFAAILAAVMSQGNITHSRHNGWKDYLPEGVNTKSDTITQAILTLLLIQKVILTSELTDKNNFQGLMFTSYKRVCEVAFKLCDAETLKSELTPTEEEVDKILEILFEVNQDRVYQKYGSFMRPMLFNGRVYYEDSDSPSRKLSFCSVVKAEDAFVIGKALDIGRASLLTEVSVIPKSCLPTSS